jgi:hypothetical protein
MSWFASIVVGLLAAALGAVAAGVMAQLVVEWYRISSFEGQSGYFVVGMALLGLIGGLLIGGIVSIRVGAGSPSDFFRALGIASAIVLGIVGIIGGTARLLADIPPTLDGEELMLAVEVRWPDAHASTPAQDVPEARLILSSVGSGSRTLRRSQVGALWTEDARRDEERWIAPGAVHLFTRRGDRVLSVVLGDSAVANFLLPLPRRITQSDRNWSVWMPRARPGEPPLPDGFTYRYRVQRTSEPVRTQTFGAFEVQTIAGRFYEDGANGRTRIAAAADFRVHYRGKPVVIELQTSESEGEPSAPRIDRVAIVSGPQAALVVHATSGWGVGECHLLVDDEGRLRVELITACDSNHEVFALTSELDRLHRSRGHQTLPGTVDRHTFAEGGMYLINEAVIDTRSLSVRRVRAGSESSPVPGVPPLALSPDEHSFVRAYLPEDYSAERFVLRVIDLASDEAYTVPIHRSRMRNRWPDLLDPGWVSHHFAWVRGPDGLDRLVERPTFTPLPNQGRLTVSGSIYQLRPPSAELQEALIEFLVAELGAERLPSETGDPDSVQLRIDGRIVQVFRTSDEIQLMAVDPVYEYALGEANVVGAIAERFDAALATGRYDAHFPD